MPDHPGHGPTVRSERAGPPATGTLMASIAAPIRGALMRPSLSILDAELIERIVDEAKRVLAEVGMEIRGPEMRRRLLEHGLPLDATRRPGPVPARRRRGRDRVRAELVPAVRPRRRAARRPRRRPRPLRPGLVRAQGPRPSDRRDAPRELDRFRRVRPARRRPRQHPVPRDGVLDQRRHRGRRVRRVAAVHDPDQLEQAGRLGRVHRARRPAHGRDDAALPSRPGRPHRPPDVDLHDHRDRQLPVQRGLLPEPDRLRRGRASRSRSCRSR